MRDVGVFPSQVKNAPVVHHRGTEVVVLLEAELANVPAVGIHDITHADVDPCIAGHALERCRRDENDPAVRQIT